MNGLTNYSMLRQRHVCAEILTAVGRNTVRSFLNTRDAPLLGIDVALGRRRA